MKPTPPFLDRHPVYETGAPLCQLTFNCCDEFRNAFPSTPLLM